MDKKQPEALRLAEQYDHGDPATHGNAWKAAEKGRPMTTTPTSGVADLPEALINIAREIEALKRDCGMDPESAIAIQNGRYMAISSEIRALAAGQATAQPAPENIRGILARCRDFIDTTKAPAYPAGVDLADEIDALLAAQAVVPADLITLRKPTTSAELLWLLKLAHLVLSDVDKTLEETFAPAQPTAQQGAGGVPAPPPECETEAEKRAFAFGWFKALESERMKAESVQEDAARYRWLREGNDAKHGAAWHVAVNLYGCEWDAAIDAARKKGEKQ